MSRASPPRKASSPKRAGFACLFIREFSSPLGRAGSTNKLARKVLAPVSFKMVDNKDALLATTQAITIFTTLLLQQYCLLPIWTINEISKYNALISFLQRKQNFRLKKLNLAKQRRLVRKKRKHLMSPGQTEEWWSNMIGGIVPEENRKKNF